MILDVLFNAWVDNDDGCVTWAIDLHSRASRAAELPIDVFLSGVKAM